MTTENIYKYAAAKRLRFASKKGNLSVEELFSANNDIIDDVYRNLKKEERELADESLFDRNDASTALSVKIDIVCDIAATRKAEAAARIAAENKKERNQRIHEIIAEKENESLKNMSIDDLKKMLDE